MNTKNIGLFVGVFTIVMVVILLTVTYFNVQSTWAKLDNACEAVFDRQRIAHDEMWKVISSQYGLKDELKETTLKVIDSYVQRGEGYKGAQFNWIQEQYPQLNQTGSADFYKNLANTIADQNGKLSAIRNDVVTVTNEYNNYVVNPWITLFLFEDQETKKTSKIITSSTTQKAADTLQDDLEWNNKRK